MCTVHFWEVICFTFINIVLCFAQHTGSSPADVIKQCENSTSSTTCIYNYEQLYKNLTKAENSFNISHALYPGRGKPSYLVKVNVFGPNKTNISTPATFTWSVRCLYAAVPGCLLEVLSLGSIIVTSRTQELSIHIPPFCCNVSDDEKKREEIIQSFLTRAITELQDIAVSPGIRDPSLNVAECIEDNQLHFKATGGHAYIRVILWLSLVFVVCSGPLLANFREGLESINRSSTIREKKSAAKALRVSLLTFLVLGVFVLSVAFGLSCFYWSKGQTTYEITVIILVICASSVVDTILALRLIDEGEDIYNRGRKYRVHTARFFRRFLPIYGAHAISYLFCWQIIGIRMNPTWGLTIALFIMCAYAALTYAIYLYFEVVGDDCTNSRKMSFVFHARLIFYCAAGGLAVLLVFFIIVFTGPSYIGEQATGDETLKTASLYFIGAFISWLAWKKHAAHHRNDPTSHSTSNPSTEKKKKGVLNKGGVSLQLEETGPFLRSDRKV